MKLELARWNALWHSMRLYRPLFTCGQCDRAVYLWCIYCDGCILCLVGVECLARRFTDRDEVKWVPQMWEKEVHVETILHLTPSMNVDGSSASMAEASGTPLDHPVPFRLESLSRHHLVITQHLLLGALVQNKSWLMCAKH